MLSAEYHIEEHNHAIGTPAHECGHELEGEKLSRKVSIRAEAKPEIPQKDKSVMSMECEIDNTASENENTRSASLQQAIDMLENNIHEHVKHSKDLLKKPLLQEVFKQTPENITIRSDPLRTTAMKDSTLEERRANCTYQCKECSNQSIQNLIEQPENSEDNQ